MDAVIAPQMFVNIMKMTIGCSTACGVGRAFCLWQSEEENFASTMGCGCLPRYKHSRNRRRFSRRAAAARAGREDGSPEGQPQSDSEDEADVFGTEDAVVIIEQHRSDEYVTQILNSAVCGGGFALLSSVPIMVALYDEPLSVVATQSGLAFAFFSPVVILWCCAGKYSEDGETGLVSGTRIVAQHLPFYMLALTAVNMGFSVGTLVYQTIALGQYPLGGIVSAAAVVKLEEDDALHYLTGCRLGMMGTTALLLGVFVNRYASIQRSKRIKEGTNKIVAESTLCMVTVCQVAGNLVAGLELLGAMMDGVGSVTAVSQSVEMIRLAYMFGLQALVSAPTDDHDQDQVSKMTRTALIGFHAIVLVPSPTSAVPIMVQAMLEESSYAAWFGTFDREWRPAILRQKLLKQGPEPTFEVPPVSCWCCCCGFEVGELPEKPQESSPPAAQTQSEEVEH